MKDGKHELLTEEQVKALQADGWTRMEYEQCANEKALYIHPKEKTIVGTWMDDIIVRGKRRNSEEFWRQCGKRFEIRSWGFIEVDKPRTYTGMKICKERRNGRVWYTIDQQDDIEDFLERYGKTGMRPSSAPMPYKDEMYSDETNLGADEARLYGEIVGALVYYADSTVWQMACEVNKLAQKLKTPTVGAQKALNRVLAWLGTFNKTHKLQVPRVKGTVWHWWCDSDCAGGRAHGDTLSRTGVLGTANGMPVHWRSQKQPTTSQSSAAAEIVALSQTVQDSRLRLWIAEDMYGDVKWPVEIQVDNAAAVTFQNKMNAGSKLRGIFDLREKWVQELKDKKLVKAVKVATDYNVSDILTKPLQATVRQKLLNHLNTVQQNVIRHCKRASI